MPPIPGPGSYAPVVRIERHQIGGLQHTRCGRARTASPGQRSVAQRPAPRPVSPPISLSSAPPRTRFRMLALCPMRSQPSPLSAGGNGVCRPGTRRSGCGSMAPGGRPDPRMGDHARQRNLGLRDHGRRAARRRALAGPLRLRPADHPAPRATGGSDEGSAHVVRRGDNTGGAVPRDRGPGPGSPGTEASKALLARRPVGTLVPGGVIILPGLIGKCSSLPRCRWT